MSTHLGVIVINNDAIHIYMDESENPNDPVGKVAHDLSFYLDKERLVRYLSVQWIATGLFFITLPYLPSIEIADTVRES